MKPPSIHIAIVLLLLVITACTPLTALRTSSPSPSIPPVNPITPTVAPSSTATPEPSATYTVTALPPSITPTITPTSTPEATPIALATQLRIFENLWAIIKDTYVYPDFNGLDWDDVRREYREKIASRLTNMEFYLAMSEMVYRLGDDHSMFLTPFQVAEQELEFQGNLDYVGIGVLVSAVPERNRAVILSVFPNSPAEAAGLHSRDSIISVNGEKILDEDGYLRDIVRGPEGTTIDVIVETPGDGQHQVSITRHRITGGIPVVHQILTFPGGKRVGYILIVTFEDSTVDEQVAEALREMTTDAPLDGLILDNRLNGGGSSTVLEPMLSYFIGGILGHFVNRYEERPLEIQLNDINNSAQVPLVVLVGPGTASFGEIYAGVLQDLDRAYLIGETTGGNVEILWGYDLEDGSQVWLANETFRPLANSENDWEKTGIIPDMIVPGDFDQFPLQSDPAVLAAIQYLMGQ